MNDARRSGTGSGWNLRVRFTHFRAWPLVETRSAVGTDSHQAVSLVRTVASLIAVVGVLDVLSVAPEMPLVRLVERRVPEFAVALDDCRFHQDTPPSSDESA